MYLMRKDTAMRTMGLRAVLLLSIATVTFASYREWSEFKLKFNKSYDNDDEELFRYAQWRKSVKTVQDHNTRADMGDHSYWMEINHFADMTDDEFKNSMFGVDVDTQEDVANNTNTLIMENLPSHVDWRKAGYVTPVKFQSFCGSCYAFSATGALEGQHFRKTGKLVSLSEQNIVDCTYHNRYGDHGCHGGLMDNAFRYVIGNGGIDTEEAYPYTAEVGRCKYSRQHIGSKASGYHDVRPRGDERALQKVVASIGPVSIGLDAHHGLKYYSYGVYDNSYCSRTRLNHGVLVVGYGADTDTGKQYWLVKNSWGRWWGEDGYFRIERNNNNMCGVATLASYPII